MEKKILKEVLGALLGRNPFRKSGLMETGINDTSFLDPKGNRDRKPMTMKDVADTIGVHESTVSRAVANKYVELPSIFSDTA